jgi:hypothetical protein
VVAFIISDLGIADSFPVILHAGMRCDSSAFDDNYKNYIKMIIISGQDKSTGKLMA